MKRFRLSYLTILTALTLLAACQGGDEITERQGGGEPETPADGLVTLGYRVGASSASTATRADDSWVDTNADASVKEMMYVWTVVIVDKSSREVKYIRASKPTGDKDDNASQNREIDDFVTLTPGEYDFYSFANISPMVVMKNLFGATSLPAATEVTRDGNEGNTGNDGNTNDRPTAWAGASVDSSDPFMSENAGTTTSYDNNKVYDFTVPSGTKLQHAEVEKMALSIAGNNCDPTQFNSFGSQGIPMTNYQTKNITTSTTFDIILIRTMAKIELQIYNATATDLVINSVALGGITQDGDVSQPNIMLLPNIDEGADDMEAHHSKITANLASTAKKGSVTIDFANTAAAAKTVAASSWDATSGTPASGKEPLKVAFYVNESTAPTEGFSLTIQMGDADYRYGIVTGTNATGHTGSWAYIARNDYRIIPIVLDDYKLQIIPYDFPEIGVYPASVHEVDATNHVYEMLFHDYGHFHLLPKVMKGTAEIPFSATSGGTGTYWTLYGAGASAAATDWTNSFTSYTDMSATTEYDLTYNSATGQFYGTPGSTGLPAANVYPNLLPAYGTAVDYSENGDWPVFYNNDGATKWKPNASDDYRPYIFGQIAPQDFGADKKVFHEFKVNLYVNGATTPRILTYRFYMHLKQDHATARRRSASRCH